MWKGNIIENVTTDSMDIKGVKKHNKMRYEIYGKSRNSLYL
jgi:hypothetical protein